MTDRSEILHELVDLFNHGARTGDFGPMMALFTEDAEMVFEGVPAGPFHGAHQIEAAYRAQPPDDQIDVWGATEHDGAIVTSYGWRRDGGARAGEMHLTVRGDRIVRLVVTFDAPPAQREGASEDPSDRGAFDRDRSS